VLSWLTPIGADRPTSSTAIKMPSKRKLVRNGPQWYNMSCSSEVCPFMATFHAAQLILFNFEELSPYWLSYVFRRQDFQTLRNTASNGPVLPHLVNGNHVCCKIWGMDNLIHIEADVRNLGLWYQVMAGIALWGRIKQIWPKVAYDGPIYVLVARYNKFWPY